MRRTLLATLAILTLLLAPAAIADGRGHGADAAAAGRSHANETAETHLENATDDHGDHANASAWGHKMSALRESFRENVTALIHGCRDADHASLGNHTDAQLEAHRSWAHCIRDGMKALREAFHAEKKELAEQKRAEHDAAAKPSD